MMNLLSYKVIYFRPNSSRKFKMAAMKTLLFFVHLIVPNNAINKNVKSYCINKMTIYVSSSYSLSSVMSSFILAQMHRHCPHPVEQSNPVLAQKQRRAEGHIPSYSYIALISAALFEQYPCHIAGTGQ